MSDLNGSPEPALATDSLAAAVTPTTEPQASSVNTQNAITPDASANPQDGGKDLAGNTIPYSRFSEVNNKYKEASTQVETMGAELNQYKDAINQLANDPEVKALIERRRQMAMQGQVPQQPNPQAAQGQFNPNQVQPQQAQVDPRLQQLDDMKAKFDGMQEYIEKQKVQGEIAELESYVKNNNFEIDVRNDENARARLIDTVQKTGLPLVQAFHVAFGQDLINQARRVAASGPAVGQSGTSAGFDPTSDDYGKRLLEKAKRWV